MDVVKRPLKLFNTIEKSDWLINKGALVGPDVFARLQDIDTIDVVPSRTEVSQVVYIGDNNPVVVDGEKYIIKNLST